MNLCLPLVLVAGSEVYIVLGNRVRACLGTCVSSLPSLCKSFSFAPRGLLVSTLAHGLRRGFSRHCFSLIDKIWSSAHSDGWLSRWHRCLGFDSGAPAAPALKSNSGAVLTPPGSLIPAVCGVGLG